MTDQLTPKFTFSGLLAKVEAAVASVARSHERAELLAAYRLRHRWKASDAARLRTLKLSPVAERRVAKLSGRGRPIVAAHIDPATSFVVKVLPLIAGFHEHAPPNQRLAAIKYSHWWPHYVEAVYRGEYEAAKAEKLKSAAEVTEEKIANALCISSAVVRKLCTKIRMLRAEDFDAANFPPATLAGFMDWIESGKRDNFLPLDESATFQREHDL